MASAQDITEGEQLLETLWREPGRADLRCLLCQEPFTDDALIRTFRVEPPGDHSPSYSIVVPTHKGDILFFDRHMSCVAEHQVRFSAVSHVWDSSISHVQRQRQTVPQTPVALSVPQWSDTLKNSIIRIMHKLFTTAETTVIYFGDVDSDVVKQLYRKERSPERLAAVISVCNSQYFKRVWTAMEFIGSGRVRMMTSDCTYFGDLDDPAFFNRLYDVWNEELRHHAQAQRLEAEVQMGKNGKNQVPWSLGALREAKDLKRVNFAMGSTLLKEGMPRPDGLPPCPERHSPCELSHSDEL
ncbi:hypothetical protein NW755_013606 [Fusarium falciforme]|uniref:Heterokaryon incompatibility domain-containing protein n=1 Tax=Fusarium falciforme TaxID=195108 RepID=A0A9W8QUA7_9HYPO|nr:hypothetical protein NW755_013606 [Fusarium falciforme]